MMTRRHRRVIVRVLVSTVLIVALLVFVDVREVFGMLLAASPALLVVLIALHTADRVLMAVKWWLLLEAENLGVSLAEAIRAYYISSFAGLFLPMTVGADIVRTVTMRHAGQTAKIIATIAVERGIGALAQFALVGLSLLVIVQLGLAGPEAMDMTRLGALIAVILLLLAICLPLSFTIAQRVANAWKGAGGLLDKLAELAAAYAGYSRHRGTLWTFLGLTVLEGFLPVTIHYYAAMALGLDVPYYVFVALVPISFLIARLPISLGGIGVQEGSFVAMALMLGFERDRAFAIVFLSQITLVVALIPGAVAYLTASEPAGPVGPAEAADPADPAEPTDPENS